ncbi:YciI family protein [Dokdonella soli]|uniref:YciI family protein n=1 Tax=Dokdonella soli TaxID=529810 RepID=A0ABN1IEA2_9GAMM
MQYLLMLYASENGWNTLTKAEQKQGEAAYAAYTEALRKAGALVGSNRLQPVASATTVRLSGGKPQVMDGPYAESKEQLGGYYLIEAADLDAAIAWAARCPGSGHGIVEVRPVWDMATYGLPDREKIHAAM